ncbi:MAG: T9SS type A sorting domain-containing protein, partial [Bacteroidota bacterium]
PFDPNANPNPIDDFGPFDFPWSNEEEQFVNQLHVSPNPARRHSKLQFENPTQQEVEIRVLNMQAQILRSERSLNESYTIQRNGLASGIYLVQVLQKGQLLGQQKLQFQ